MASRRVTTVSPEEIAQFSRHAEDWWNASGSFRPLHRLNPLRLRYIRDHACAHFGRDPGSRQPIKGLALLDVGCGGGLLSEPLARLGAKVIGVDASREAIDVAKRHAKEVGVKLDYRHSSVEELARGSMRFDIITALEIAEHVADLESFVASLSDLIKPGGLLFMSTLNRTPKSFVLGIVAAEYILKWVPRGTHSWTKFIRPSELVQTLGTYAFETKDLTGVVLNPMRNEFELSKKDLAMNYMLAALKMTC